MAGPRFATPSDVIEPMQVNLVRDELDRVCADKLFKHTTRMKRFLRYVVEEALEGRGDRIKGYVIGVEVFDRPDSFDPQADTIVRVQAGQLRRRLELYYAAQGKSSLVRILIPKGRYAPTFEFRQNPQVNETVDPIAIVNEEVNRTNDPRPSLAIMTLDDLSSEKFEGGKYFAEGLSVEIVNALVQFRSLRIVMLAPTVLTNVVQKSTKDIGKETGVDFILSGSVRRDGEDFRVTVNLIQCETSEHIFSRVFNRKYKAGDLFALQEEIASYTAAAIAAPYGAVNRYKGRGLDEHKTCIDAYNCLLRYYDMKLSPRRRDVLKRLKDIESMTELYPEFSTGWAIRSLLNNFLAVQIHTEREARNKLIEADRTARLAIKANSQNALGYFALFQSLFHRGEFEDANRAIEHAIALNPNDYSILSYYGVCLAAREDYETARTMGATALRLIGRAPTWYYVPQMMSDFSQGKYDVVAGLVDHELEVGSNAFYLMGLAAKAHLGEVEEARAIIAGILVKNPDYAQIASTVLACWHINADLAQKIDAGLSLVGLSVECLKPSG